MRCLVGLAVLCSMPLFLAAASAENEPGPEVVSSSTAPVLEGTWSLKSLIIQVEGGKKEKYPNTETKGPFTAIISEKTLTLWTGNQKFAEMTFESNSLVSPATLDVKYQGLDMVGIFMLDGNILSIRLNDTQKGRPSDFQSSDCNIAMNLIRFRGEPLQIMKLDGSKPRALSSMTDYTSCGSPRWSRDGKKIVCDAWKSWCGENWQNSHIVTLNADGSSPKDLGDGTLPSFSPDGKQIIYGRYTSDGRIWIMNADGSENRCLDPDGWGPDWSPIKDEVVYVKSNEGTENLCVRNVTTGEWRFLLKKTYQDLSYGLSWSPDGQWICFKGTAADGSPEIAVVHTEGEAKGFKTLISIGSTPGLKAINNYVTWSPDGKQVVVALLMESDTNYQFYRIDVEGKTPPEWIPGQDPARVNYIPAWSPDGQSLLFAFAYGRPPKQKKAPEAATVSPETTSNTKRATIVPAPTAEGKVDLNSLKPTFEGNWRATSLTLSFGKGRKETYPNNEISGPLHALLTKKSIGLWTGPQCFAEMSCELHPEATPATIDVQFQNFKLVGIYRLDGNQLQIRLNDAEIGRPKDFEAKDASMAMDLTRFWGNPIFVLNAEGTELRPLATLPDYTDCGSPRWSRDGKTVVCDAWRSWCGEEWGSGHIIAINADGSSGRDLGDGGLPSMSSDGKKVTYSSYTERGIWIMNADGTEKRMIDPSGWSSDWSPTKNEIAYTRSNDAGSNIGVMDLNTDEIRFLLKRSYRYVYYGLSWSPDGKWVAFKGDLPDGTSEIAIVSAEREAKGFKVLISKEKMPGIQSFSNFVNWTPDGKFLTIAVRFEGDSNQVLYLVDIEEKLTPRRLPGQDPSYGQCLSSWSPDGKQIVFSTRPGNPPKKNELAEKK